MKSSLILRNIFFQNQLSALFYSQSHYNLSKFDNYCFESVKKKDYENYLSLLFLKGEPRSIGFALRCFNIELSNIIDSVSNPEIAKLKFKYWENELNLLLIGKTSHSTTPVIKALDRKFKDSTLTKIWLKRIFQARMKMIYESPFTSMDDANQYFEDVNSSVLYILADVLGVSSIESDHILSHVGKCQGLVTLIRGIPMLAHYRKKVLLPNDIVAKFGLSHSEILKLISTPQSNELLLKDLVFYLASLAKTHLSTAVTIHSKLSNNSKIIQKLCAPYVPLERYLEKLRLVDFKITDSRLYQPDGMLPLYMWREILFRKRLKLSIDK